MLEDAGYDVLIAAPSVDDGCLERLNVAPKQWVMSLAYLKARSALQQLDEQTRKRVSVVVGADTVCVVDGVVLGQPVDASDARTMICAMRNRAHQTMTGVCLIDPDDDRRMFAVDVATVILGAVTDAQLDAYIASEDWRGKAGGYNLAERVACGWPIECAGDPTTVMGLPMLKLPQWLNSIVANSSQKISSR